MSTMVSEASVLPSPAAPLWGELRYSGELARLLARSALERTESRGAHQRLDYPERDPALDQRHFVIAGDGSGSWQRWV